MNEQLGLSPPEKVTQWSPSVTKLADALVKAQAQMTSAKKDSKNPHFNSAHASLDSVIEAIKGPLTDHGIVFLQLPTMVNGEFCLRTLLLHTSGEWLSSDYPIRPTKQDPQGVGSAITYARRYSLKAICGIPEIDDDAEVAMGRPHSPGIANPAPMNMGSRRAPTEKQLKRLYAIQKSSGWSVVELQDYMYEHFKVNSSKELDYFAYELLCKHLESHPKIKPLSDFEDVPEQEFRQ